MSVVINVGANESALAASIAKGVSQFNSRLASKNKLNLQVNQKSFTQPLGRITADLDDFEKSMKAANARVLAFGASAAVIGGVAAAFREVADSTIQVEKNIIDINRILNLSTKGLQSFTTDLFKITKETAVSFQDAATASQEFARQGLGAEETLRRTKDALILVRLAGVDSAKAVSDLTAAVNGFSREGLTTTEIVNKIVAVEEAFAVSAKDLTEALSRSGQAALEAGVSFDQLNALVAAAQEVTARGGAVIGNSFKTIFQRLQRPAVLENLESFNIKVRDLEGNTLPAIAVLQNFANVYKDLGSVQKAYLAEQVGGVFQANILKAVINDLGKAQSVTSKALEIGTTATDQATVANERLNKSLTSLISRTSTGLLELSSNIGKVTFEPIATALLKPLNDIVNTVNKVLEGEGIGSTFANGLLLGIKNVLMGPGLLGVLAIIGKVAKNTFTDIANALPNLIGISTEAQKRANIEKAINAILSDQSDISKSLLGLDSSREDQVDLLYRAAQKTTTELRQQKKIAAELAQILSKQNVVVGSAGLQISRRGRGSRTSFASGFIPEESKNFEQMSAVLGGYTPGSVVKSPVGGVMNTAEEVKFVPGFEQPFINPPVRSKAGKDHRKNSIKKIGIDPYSALGFIPNFFPARNLIKFPGETQEQFQARVDEQKKGRTKKKKGKTVTLDTKGQIGLLSLFSEGPRGTTNEGVASVKAESLSGAIRNSAIYKKLVGADYKGQISLKNIQLRALDQITDLSGGVKSGDFSNFTKRIDEELLTATSRIISKSPLARVFPNPKISATEIKNNLAKDKIWDDIFPAPVQGSMFEYAIRAGTKTSKEFAQSVAGDKNAAFDFEESGGASSDFKKLFGFSASKVDGKRTSSLDAVNSLVRKSFNSGIASSFGVLSSGFVPNFAYKDSVMNLEENLSGEKAVFSKKPFPHVRNASQPSFNSAIADHGGLKKALKDSFENQLNAGLMSQGFIPNFVGKIRGPKGGLLVPGTSGLGNVALSREKSKLLIRQLNSLITAYEKGKITQDKLNQSADRLIDKNNIISDQRDKLKTRISKQLKAIDEGIVAEKSAARAQAQRGKDLFAGRNQGLENFKSSFLGQTRFGRGMSLRIARSQRRGGLLGRAATVGGRLNGSPAAGLGLAIGLPLIAGEAESLITGGKPRSQQSVSQRFLGGGISKATSFGTTGAFIGSAILGPGLGTAIGAATGAIVGLGIAAFGAQDTFEDIAERNGQILARLAEQEQQIDIAISAQKQIEAGGLTKSEIAELIRQRNQALEKVQPGVASDNRSVEGLIKSRERIRKNVSEQELKNDINNLNNLKDREQSDKDIARRSAISSLVRLGESNKALKTILGGIDKITRDASELELDLTKEDIGTQLNSLFEGDIFKTLDQELQSTLKKTFKGISGVINTPILVDARRKLKEEKEEIDRETEGDGVGASNLVRGLKNIFLEESRILSEQLARDTGALALRKEISKFNISFAEGIEDSTKLLQKGFDDQLGFLREEEQIRRTKSLADFKTQFTTPLESILSEAELEKIRDILTNQSAESAKDLDIAITDLVEKIKEIDKTVFPKGEEQRQGLIQNIEGFRSSEVVAKINFDNQVKLNIEKLRQLKIEDTLLKKELDNIFKLDAVLAKRNQDIKDLELNLNLDNLRRSAELEDPTRFFGLSREQRAEVEIQNLRKNFENRRVLEEAAIFTSAQQAAQNPLQRAQQLEAQRRDPSVGVGDYLKTIRLAKESQKELNNLIEEGNLKNIRAARAAQINLLENIEDNEKNKELRNDISKSIQELDAAEKDVLRTSKQINEELKIREETLRRTAKIRGTASFGFRDAVDQIQQEARDFPETFARNTTFAFRDGLVSAMDAAANSTGSLKDSLLNVAADFARSIQQAMFTQAANQIVGSFGGFNFGSQKGGLIKAQNGMYISGGRTGDKNLALLEDGEYVLNRKAVKGLGGPSVLNSINYNEFPRFANGGQLKRLKSGERKLSPNIDFNKTLATEGEAFAFINEAATSERLTGFARENTVFIKEYNDQLRREAERKRRERAQKKAQRRQLIISAITSAIGFGVSGVMSAAFAPASAQAVSSSFSGGAFGGGQTATRFGGANIGPLKNVGGRTITSDNLQASMFDPFTTAQKGGFIKANSGGYVPYGSRITDSVPALLTGGEYIVNSKAVKRYGLGGLNRINSGIQKFQEGGEMSSSSSSSSNLTNNLSFSFNIDAKSSKPASIQSKDDKEENINNENKKYNEFSKKVRNSVLEVIKQEQRVGGLLDQTKKRTQ